MVARKKESKEVEMTLDDLEIYALKSLCSGKLDSNGSDLLLRVADAVIAEIRRSDVTSPSSLRGGLSGCWRVLGSVFECALTLTSASTAHAVFPLVTESMKRTHCTLGEVIASGGFDPTLRDTLLIYGGFNLCYTSIVRTGLESVSALLDPVLGCDFLLGLESILPMDNKGISNVYKISRTETPSSDGTVSPVVSSEDPNVRSYEKYWAMMDLVVRKDPELLSETKWWGKFSQSATATFTVCAEGVDLSLPGIGPAEPLEYQREQTSFPVQLTSVAFRRRAILNIVFMCGYLIQNSGNALITAGAKNLLGTILKSIPSSSFSVFLESVLRMENHWVNWKSTVCSKEVCGPFETATRIERNMAPFADSGIAELEQMSTVSTPAEIENPVISLIQSFDSDDSRPTGAETNSMEEYREYVKSAIICDISDEAEAARLASSDAGIEEALQRNNETVLLWQFKRMRFNTDAAMDTQ
jgi:hypothetical protein